MDSNVILSEEDLELSPTDGQGSSPSINLGSHLPNPLNLPSNTKKVPSDMTLSVVGKKVPSSVTLVSVGKDSTSSVLGNGKVPSELKLGEGKQGGVQQKDRINNVTQKEEAMASAGVTRIKTYAVIFRLLDAMKEIEVVDKAGNVRKEMVPDLAAQARGAEMALKAMGDMIEHKQVDYGVADSTLEKLKALSVAELRMRALELLEGRKRAVDVVAVSVR